jgi:hypothetical protein
VFWFSLVGHLVALLLSSPRTPAAPHAALCWQREREITDTLVELLIHIAHRVGVRAEEKVEIELMKYLKKVMGKARLLYKLAKAAKGQPDGVVEKCNLPRRQPGYPGRFDSRG